MFKKEIIWRELLYQALEKKNRRFQQQELAGKFGFSLSTVFNALKTPRAAGAVKRRGREFVLESPEKLLYLWASVRRVRRDLIYQTHVSESAKRIETLMPPGAVFGGYTAFAKHFGTAPADYDKVYVYADKPGMGEIARRFPTRRHAPNLFILKADPFLVKYGACTTIGQVFVDIWNLPEWYAHDFSREFQRLIAGII